MASMIIQHTRSILRKKFPGVIRDLAAGKNTEYHFIALANQDKNLYILKHDGLEITQKIEFSQWVRCVSTGDLTNNGNSEIVIGLGDNSLRILKYDEESGLYKEFCSEKFDNFVNCCAIADINGNSNLEIIAGSFDKTLRVYSLTDLGLNEIWRRIFLKGIHSIKVADITWNNQLEIAVLFKDQGMVALNGFDGKTIWEFSSEKALLTCDIGILDSTGYPYTVVGGNDKILYFLDINGNLESSFAMDERITSILISDINGNTRNEVIVGCGPKYIHTYEFPDALLSQFHLKWKYKLHGVINKIIFEDITHDSKKEIIYAGYDRAVNVIRDFFFGETILEEISIAPYYSIPEVTSQKEISSLFSSVNDPADALAAGESHPEIRIPNGRIDSITSGNAAGIRSDTQEISTVELIPHIFQDVEYYSSKAKLLAAFVSGGLDGSGSLILFDDLKKQGVIRYQRTSPRGYYLVDQVAKISQQLTEKPIHAKIPSSTLSGTQKVIESSILKKAQTLLEEKGFFSSKAILINTLRSGEIPEIEINPIIDYFKTKMYLSYSRKAPRGYSFIGEKGIKAISKVSVPSGISTELIEQAKAIFREKKIITSKVKIFEAFAKLNLSQTQSEKLLNILKDRSIIIYSAKKPRGYHYIDGISIEKVLEKSSPEKITRFKLSDELLSQIENLFKKNPIFSSKKALLEAFDSKIKVKEDITMEKLFNSLKTNGYIHYSKKTPRGYSYKKNI